MNNPQLRNILCIGMVILYAAGLICFFLGAMEQGFALWGISTVGGFLLLYFIRKRREDAEEKKSEDDSPCE